MSYRIGIGNDTHRLAPGEGLFLGGIYIPCDWQATAHSDGDVLLHALTDALLGAIGAGDIGELFPDTAEENRDRASADFVTAALRGVRERGFEIANIDAVVQLEAPRLSPHKSAIRASIAQLCALNESQVSVKAKSGEGLPPVGSHQAITAVVVTLLETDATEAS